MSSSSPVMSTVPSAKWQNTSHAFSTESILKAGPLSLLIKHNIPEEQLPYRQCSWELHHKSNTVALLPSSQGLLSSPVPSPEEHTDWCLVIMRKPLLLGNCNRPHSIVSRWDRQTGGPLAPWEKKWVFSAQSNVTFHTNGFTSNWQFCWFQVVMKSNGLS